MATKKKYFKNIEIGSSIFWLLISLIGMGFLLYLLIWGIANDNLRALGVGVVFGIMILTGISLSRGNLFNSGTWNENAVSFTFGFIIWGLLSGGLFPAQVTTFFTITESSLFASLQAALPQHIEVLMNGFVIPIAEEVFWMFAIPSVLFTITQRLGRRWPFFANDYFQISLIALVASVTFAFFHVGREALVTFIIAAIFFRTILVVLVFSEREFNWLKKFNLVIGFSLGAHIANNLFVGGLGTALTVLQPYPAAFWTVVLFFGACFITTIVWVIRKLSGRKEPSTAV